MIAQIVFFVALFAGLKSASVPTYDQAPIVRHNVDIKPDGTHEYLYETENGIYEDQQGYPKGPDTQAVQGQFQFQSPEGHVFRVTYVADENGYQPQGDHLPTPPPIPADIQKALDYLATLPPQQENKLRGA